MHNTKLILALLTTAIVAVRGQDLENDDIPPECRSVCAPVIQLENQCDNQFDDDDDDDDNNQNNGNQQYQNCVCTGANAQQAFSTCNACVVQYPNYFIDDDDDNDDTDDNEVEQWIRRCGFQQTAPTSSVSAGTTPAPTSRTAAPTATQSLTTSTIIVTYPDDDGDDDDDDDDDDVRTSTIVSVFPVGAAPTLPPNANTNTRSVSYSTTVSTNQQGSATTIRTPAATFDGAGAVATAAPILGAGAAIILAGMAF